MRQMPKKQNPKGLTRRGINIVEVLRQHGGWMTRNEIAEALHKRALGYHDRDILERLQEAGYIKIDKHIRDDMVAEYLYQATDKPLEDKK